MVWIGAVGGIVGILSSIVTVHHWWKVNKKIAMLSDASRAAEVLPAWYTTRMMTDHWCFGLLTQSGRTIAITRITAISDDGKWMDVELAAPEELVKIAKQVPDLVGAIADDRPKASIQVSHIVAARELWTS